MRRIARLYVLSLLGLIDPLTTSPEAEAREQIPREPPRPAPLMMTEIGPDLRRCSAEAEARGEFGDVIVEIAKLSIIKVVPSRQVGRATYRCVQIAVERLLEMERRAPKRRVDPEHQTGDVPIGRPRPLLPAIGALLPAWDQHVGASPAQQDATRRELQKLLPPDVAVDNGRCLAPEVEGLIIDESISQWLQTVGHEVPEVWRYIFDGRSSPNDHAPPAFLVSSGRVLRVLSTPRRLCLENIEGEQTRRQLRQRMEALGSCWAGDLNDILMTPRIEFPRDRRFKLVTLSPSGATACALDVDGHPFCCGRNANKYPPLAGPFTDLAISGRGAQDFGACGVKPTPAGTTVECWGDTPAPPPSLKIARFIRQSFCGVAPSRDIACVSGAVVPLPAPARGEAREAAFQGNTVCAVATSGKISCARGAVSKTFDGTFSNVDVGADSVCALDQAGQVHCWDTHTLSPLSLSLADRSFRQIAVGTSGSNAFCGITSAAGIECVPLGPDSRPPSVPGGSQQFVQIGEAAGRFCGVTSSSRVECWGETWPPVIRTYETRKPFGGLRLY